jgi:hypothetical protein
VVTLENWSLNLIIEHSMSIKILVARSERRVKSKWLLVISYQLVVSGIPWKLAI